MEELVSLRSWRQANDLGDSLASAMTVTGRTVSLSGVLASSMKNPVIEQLAAEDLRSQVDKVLRGLGNPEPPPDLRDVRDLLRRDIVKCCGWARSGGVLLNHQSILEFLSI